MSKFMVASKQARELDKKKLRLDAIVRLMEKELSRQVGERMELEGKVQHLEFEVTELKNLVEELKKDIIKKESHLDHLQKKNEELSSSMDKAEAKDKDKAIKEFKALSRCT